MSDFGYSDDQFTDYSWYSNCMSGSSGGGDGSSGAAMDRVAASQYDLFEHICKNSFLILFVVSIKFYIFAPSVEWDWRCLI